MFVVVDTNVLIVANGRATPQANPTCVTNCVRRLQSIRNQEVLVIDDGWHILSEYRRKVSPSGQPGVGDAFLKWVLTNQKNPNRCVDVSITPIPGEESFVEFPSDVELANFDRSDRKFVAVALTHPAKPPILNAVDSDWRDFYQPLARNGVQIEFLCPEILAPCN
ncbi:MAG: hypothetical protein KME35_16290 [Aphanocapsa sp. GSE-SYN-MK-11-07L]|jgi:hypothetical protein|nr:hypothetical protein [Aphanocapsa sp. GSE-SYN-MK-11-07L]